MVDLPVMMNSAQDEFANAALGVPATDRYGADLNFEDGLSSSDGKVGEPKPIEFEIQTPTHITSTDREVISLGRTTEAQIDEMRSLLEIVRSTSGLRRISND